MCPFASFTAANIFSNAGLNCGVSPSPGTTAGDTAGGAPLAFLFGVSDSAGGGAALTFGDISPRRPNDGGKL